jgi:hypothetical protein
MTAIDQTDLHREARTDQRARSSWYPGRYRGHEIVKVPCGSTNAATLVSCQVAACGGAVAAATALGKKQNLPRRAGWIDLPGIQSQNSRCGLPRRGT